jgi:formylglycine-generating enzyme required for sulfatase activity
MDGNDAGDVKVSSLCNLLSARKDNVFRPVTESTMDQFGFDNLPKQAGLEVKMKKDEEEGGRKAEFQWEFAQIPAGEFMMGASPDDDEAYSDEKPLHGIRITHSFELGCYPVTQGMWKSVMGSNPSFFNGKNRPVESVSWNDTQEFIKKLKSLSSCCLPSFGAISRTSYKRKPIRCHKNGRHRRSLAEQNICRIKVA